MHLPLVLLRLFIVVVSIVFCTVMQASPLQATTLYPFSLNSIIFGIGGGVVLGTLIVGIDLVLRRVDLKSFNTLTLGLFFGFLMGEAIFSIFSAAIETSQTILPFSAAWTRSAIFLLTCYFGIIVTWRSAGELYLSIPFIRLIPNSYRKKDLLIDSSALCDSRLLDLATTGLLDQQLIVPRYLTKEFQEQLDAADETLRVKARRALDAVRRLESMPCLEMRYTESECLDIKDPVAKILKLGNLLDANILTTDIPRSHQPTVGGPRIININTLSRALKPLSQSGEVLTIKIQRYGKEPRQGVGYLDDGTMVVVNGGAQYLGSTIRTQVLSAKHTTSGRMIFCNAIGNENENEPMITFPSSDVETVASNYFSH